MTDTEEQIPDVNTDLSPGLVDESANEKLKPRPIRELLIGGFGFIAFLTIMVFAINAVGVENLQRFIEEAGPWAPLIYISMKAATYVFAPLTSGPIQVVAGTLFGNIWLGVLYTLIGEVIGGSISFWIARRFGRSFIRRFVGEAGMNQIDDFYKRRMGGWVSLAVARIILFSVWDFLSYAAGLGEAVRFRSYVLISIFFGALPTVFFVWIGTQALEDSRSLLLIYGLVAAMILIPVLARKQIEGILNRVAELDKKKRGDDV